METVFIIGIVMAILTAYSVVGGCVAVVADRLWTGPEAVPGALAGVAWPLFGFFVIAQTVSNRLDEHLDRPKLPPARSL